MKKLYSLIIVLMLAAGNLFAVPAESRRFTPYFDMNLTQGAYLPTKGDFFTGANVGMTVGLLSKITDNHSIFTLYNLGFSGQGFRFPDTEEFASKTLSHNFNMEYHWKITDFLRVRPGGSYGFNYTRTAAGEIWGDGLYDSKSIGGQMSVDYLFNLAQKAGTLSLSYTYRSIKFPNYTDIIREFQGLDANTELAGGLKDQILGEVGLSFYWNIFFARFRYNKISFKNEKVVEASGVYGNTKQEDTNTIMSAGFNGKLWIFETSPQVKYTLHDSNQNFLLFQSVTDPTPEFAGSYYNYYELEATVPLFINITKKWALNGGLDYRFRKYSSRQPRDTNNNFAGGTQNNNMVTLTAGFRKKMNEVSAMILTYSSVVATSNNKFERYLPYNYAGQNISITYQLTY